MALTIKKIKDIMSKLEFGGVDEVYHKLINKILESVVSFEKEMIEKLTNLEAEGILTKDEAVELLAEIRWQSLSSIAAKAGLDRGLKESTVAGELLMKYEQLSEAIFSQSILGAIENMKAKLGEKESDPETKTSEDSEEEIDMSILTKRPKNTLLN